MLGFNLAQRRVALGCHAATGTTASRPAPAHRRWRGELRRRSGVRQSFRATIAILPLSRPDVGSSMNSSISSS